MMPAGPPFALHAAFAGIGHGDAFWYVGRSSGFVAYGLLVGSLALGLGISTRVLDGLLPRAWFFELHKFISLIVIAVSLFHVLSFVPDRHLGLSPGDLFIPFHARTNPGPKVFAIATLYLMAVVTASFYVTQWIGQKAWRRLHYASFAILICASVHALWAGSDAGATGVRLAFFALGVMVVFLVFYRTLASRGNPRPKSPNPEKRSTATST